MRKRDHDSVIAEYQKAIDRLHDQLEQKTAEYTALDQGMDELKDSYEQMALDWRDELIRKDHRIEQLEAAVADHHKNCLFSINLPDNNYTPLDEDTHTHERLHNEPEREDHPRTDRQQ